MRKLAMPFFTVRDSALRWESQPFGKPPGLLSQVSGRVFGMRIAACWVGRKAPNMHFEPSSEEGRIMDSSMMERWLKIMLYGMVVVKGPSSVNKSAPRTIRAPTSSGTAESGARAGKSLPRGCSRQTEIGEELSIPRAAQSSLAESYELEDDYYREAMSRHGRK